LNSRYRFYQNTPDIFEIQSQETLREYRVNIALHTCSCREWQAYGFPCDHALAIIIKKQENPQFYAESFYSLNAFRNTYANSIMHPRNNEPVGVLEFGPLPPFNADNTESSDDDVALPPTVTRQPGRPRKNRTEEERERQRKKRGTTQIQRCTTCREIGHKKRTCTGPLIK